MFINFGPKFPQWRLFKNDAYSVGESRKPQPPSDSKRLARTIWQHMRDATLAYNNDKICFELTLFEY